MKSHKTEQFIKKANKIHNNKYDYSLVDYIDCKTKVKIICPIHGVFEQNPYTHYKRKCGCPNCRSSKGELKVQKYLKKNKISFIREKTFDDCRHLLPLPFDFYLPDHNICIEYDGEQHFKEIKSWGGNEYLEKIKKRDKIKTKFCKDNNIPLIRISYKEQNDIIKILNEKLKVNKRI